VGTVAVEAMWVNGIVLRHNAGLMPFIYFKPYLAIAILLGGLAPVHASDALPQRIVSIGLCTDQLLLMMVERERIASVSYSAAEKESSYMFAAVGNIPTNRTGVEEIISFKPDLVVGSTYAAQDTARFLQELGYDVRMTDPPKTIEGVRQLVLQFGEWTGAQQKAQQLVTDMDARLLQTHARHDHKPVRSIMVYSPNGYTIGSGTLEDEIFKEAGYRNLSAEMGVKGFQTVSMEQLVAAQPDFIQIDNYIYNQNSLASTYINHPVLKEVVPMERRLYMPTTLRDCAGPMVVDAIEYLASRR
jgi:iron complex transport system substrate-binding protein